MANRATPWSAATKATLPLVILIVGGCGSGPVDSSATPSVGAASGTEYVTPWILGSEDGQELVILVELGDRDCNVPGRVDVDETEDSVEITAYALTVGEDACLLEDDHQAVPVTLDAPLGRRALTGCLLEEAREGDPRTACDQVMRDPIEWAP
jgi:hypothetical protein